MFTNHELSNEVDKEFKELLIKAQEFKNLTEQLEFFENQEARFRFLGIISLVQIYFSRNLGRNVEIQTDDLSYLFRALLDIARHVPSSLPAGIYNFNYYTLKSVTENICKNLTD
ncbi:hypothetical protein [Bacillus sp. FSL W7-1334]|uniref:hypothetical protein n=1 Tax=Bacillus sp. FSL W7-1334 TaxID=2921703 RepID=UPI002E1A5183|nr:hypothetical protein [Bacillus thuringiensis]HDR3897123.1 hypothetical protein [Bacillus cereus]